MITQKTYWIDRFDHILSEEEYCSQSIISFVDVESTEGAKFEEYIALENRLKAFLTDLTLSIEPNISNIKIESQKTGSLKLYMNQSFPDWKFALLNQLDQSQEKIIVNHIYHLEELDFYLELALREKIDLKVCLRNCNYKIGFDLKIFIECDKDLLSTLTTKHSLHILSEDCESN